MTTVDQLLKIKNNHVFSINSHALIFKALQIMSDERIGALLVVDNGKMVGVFSERDYARKLALKGKSSKDTEVSQLMTKDVLYVGPQTTINDCMALMTEKRVRHLPVLKNNQLIGIVTIGDVVKQVISDQEFQIQQLESYIAGDL